MKLKILLVLFALSFFTSCNFEGRKNLNIIPIEAEENCVTYIFPSSYENPLSSFRFKQNKVGINVRVDFKFRRNIKQEFPQKANEILKGRQGNEEEFFPSSQVTLERLDSCLEYYFQTHQIAPLKEISCQVWDFPNIAVEFSSFFLRNRVTMPNETWYYQAEKAINNTSLKIKFKRFLDKYSLDIDTIHLDIDPKPFWTSLAKYEKRYPISQKKELPDSIIDIPIVLVLVPKQHGE